MSNKVLKDFKPFIIKLIIITMSICYVFGPAHLEVKMVLHHFAHYIKKPSFVITHSGHDNTAYKKLIAENKGQLRSIRVELHSHEIIDWFAGILKHARPEKVPLGNNNITFKIDKHINNKNSSKYEFVEFFKDLGANYALIKDKPRKGFIRYLKKPPILV